MRPLKEIFIEEYWDIAFRRYSNNDTVVDADKKSYAFDELKATKRYWYADPFLFEKNNVKIIKKLKSVITEQTSTFFLWGLSTIKKG